MFKNAYTKAKSLSSSAYAKAGVATSLSLMSLGAHAALSAEEQAAADAITLKINDLLAMAWSIVPIVVVGFIGIKLFKKSSNAAT
ncbi:major coat protein [Neptunomonas sp.]|uniref:major coat protein n=1 Tax=Neptunomonas sp. TaxID=1971898 RepID=UPI0025CC2587|nr:major coat protein [Neptunomonas sp.]